MSRLEVEKVKALLEQATPGKWNAFYKRKYDEWHVTVPIPGSLMTLGLFHDGVITDNPEADAKLTALAPDLARAYLALTAERDALREAGLDIYAALQALERHALPMLAIHGDPLPPETLALHVPKVQAALALLAPTEASQ